MLLSRASLRIFSPRTAVLATTSLAACSPFGGVLFSRASSSVSGGGDARLAAARLELELAKIAREKAEADTAALRVKVEVDAVTRRLEIEVDAAAAEARAVAARAEAEVEAAKAMAAAEARAMAARAEAEADAAKAKAAAEARAVAARAEAEVDAAKAKAAAEARAVAARAEAEAARAKVEVEAEAARAKVELGAARERAAMEGFVDNVAKARVWIVAAFCLGLAIDYFVHESTDFIKLRMLMTLRKCNQPPSLSPTPTTVFATAQMPLRPGFHPVLLLGPSGCGKSTLLGRMATSLPTPTPVVLVRMRLPSSSTGDAPVSEAKTLMDAAARQVFSQIGYPLRRSLVADVADVLSRGFYLQDKNTQGELDPSTRDRLVAALHLLFDVCETLKRERQRFMSPLEAAPLLLFDEAQDLIKDTRLRRAGGQLVLDMLGSLIVGYCVDRQAVRVVVAGSSAELDFASAASTSLRRTRWQRYNLMDPGLGAVHGALQAGGYSAEEARSMTDLCGTRLRLLQDPLTQGPATVSAADFLADARAEGGAAFACTFSGLSRADARLLVRVLDSIAACDAGQAEEKARPVKESLPAVLLGADMAPVLFVNAKRELFFQSQLHSRMWAQVREKYS